MNKKATSIFILVFLLFLVLFNYPLVEIFNTTKSPRGTPLLLFYLLICWSILVLILWAISHTLLNSKKDEA